MMRSVHLTGPYPVAEPSDKIMKVKRITRMVEMAEKITKSAPHSKILSVRENSSRFAKSKERRRVGV